MRKHHYRYVTGLTHGRSPNPDDTVRLTAVGMFHAGQMDTNGLMQAFLAALTAVTKAQRSVEPKPTAAVPVVLLGDRLTKEAAVATGINIAPRQLYELLDQELATWTGLMQNGEDWQWDVTQLYLNPYRNVTTAPQYLAALETAVSEPPVPTEAAILSPLALPDALDHLDLAWRLVTGPEAGDHWPSWPPRDHDTTGFDPGGIREPVQRARRPAQRLHHRRQGGQERRHTGGQESAGTPSKLGVRLGDKARRAQDAVDMLHHIARARASQQHRCAGVDAERARNALRLNFFNNNWPAAGSASGPRQCKLSPRSGRRSPRF